MKSINGVFENEDPMRYDAEKTLLKVGVSLGCVESVNRGGQHDTTPRGCTGCHCGGAEW